MRILIVTHRMPWPAAGGAKVRAFHMIERLRARGHRVVLAAPYRDAQEQQGIAEWTARGVVVLSAPIGRAGSLLRALAYVPTPLPSSFGFFWSPELAAKVRSLIRSDPPDVAIAYSSSVARYIEHTENLPLMLDFVDSDGQKWLDYSKHAPFPMSLVYALEGRKLRRLETRYADRFDLCVAISPTELRTLQVEGRRARYDWFSNGVDHEYFSPRGPTAGAGDELSFIGRMDYYPNIQGVLWFVQHVWPGLREMFPALRLRVIGAEPDSRIRALHETNGIHVTGTVDDVRDHLAQSAINIAPLQIARGMQNKVLEAMSMSLPVICSPEAADGIEAEVGKELVVARGPTEFVDAIETLLRDPARRLAIGHAARTRILAQYGWNQMLDRFTGLVEDLTTTSSVRPGTYPP